MDVGVDFGSNQFRSCTSVFYLYCSSDPSSNYETTNPMYQPYGAIEYGAIEYGAIEFWN